jgi:hypothetical protein
MANLITLTSYIDFKGNDYTTATSVTFNTQKIVRIQTATAAQIAKYPSANASVTIDYMANNIRFNGDLIVVETKAAIITAAG